MVRVLAEQTSSLGPVEPALFFGFAALICLSAWAVVLSQNIVRMAVYLLLTLAGAAGFYFMLNAEFLAAIQLVIYVGGTLTLIVFGVMLTSKNPFMQLKVQFWEKLVAIALGLALAGLLLFALVRTALPAGVPQTAVGYEGVAGIGKALLTHYLLPFEVAGVLLLVVMIGAAYMARRRAK